MLKQFSSQSPALKRRVNRDVKQRRLIKDDLRYGKRRHSAVNVQPVVEVPIARLLANVFRSTETRGRVFQSRTRWSGQAS